MGNKKTRKQINPKSKINKRIKSNKHVYIICFVFFLIVIVPLIIATLYNDSKYQEEKDIIKKNEYKNTTYTLLIFLVIMFFIVSIPLVYIIVKGLGTPTHYIFNFLILLYILNFIAFFTLLIVTIVNIHENINVDNLSTPLKITGIIFLAPVIGNSVGLHQLFR